MRGGDFPSQGSLHGASPLNLGGVASPSTPSFTPSTSTNPNRFGIDVTEKTQISQLADVLCMGLQGGGMRDITSSDTVLMEDHFMYKINSWFEVDPERRVVTLIDNSSTASQTTNVVRAMTPQLRPRPVTPTTTTTNVGTPPPEQQEPPLPPPPPPSGSGGGVVSTTTGLLTNVITSLPIQLVPTMGVVIPVPTLPELRLVPPGPQRVRYVTYYPVAFAALRKSLGMSAERIKTECGNCIWKTTGSPGKSGSMFFFFGSFVMKSISKEEWTYLKTVLYQYIQYMRANTYSLLAHMYQIIRIKNLATNERYRFVITNNVFRTQHLVPLVYDLKGSCVGRDGLIPPNGDGPSRNAHGVIIRKDNNVEGKLIKVGHTKRAVLLSMLRADTTFLSQVGIVDYSLLIGVRSRLGFRDASTEVTDLIPTTPVDQRVVWAVDGGMVSTSEFEDRDVLDGTYREEIYYLGIVDILQPYNSRKKLETITKSIVYDRNDISVIPPEDYAKRMCAMVERIST